MEQLSSDLPCEIPESASGGPRGHTGGETSSGEEESGHCSYQDLPHQGETGHSEGEALSGKRETRSETLPWEATQPNSEVYYSDQYYQWSWAFRSSSSEEINSKSNRQALCRLFESYNSD